MKNFSSYGNELRFHDKLDSGGDLEVELQLHGDDVAYTRINKEKAIELIAHLESGVMELTVPVRFTYCINCKGTGTYKTVDFRPPYDEYKSECQSCKGLGWKPLNMKLDINEALRRLK
jgi:DnaJ-class molecular chaperone